MNSNDNTSVIEFLQIHFLSIVNFHQELICIPSRLTLEPP